MVTSFGSRWIEQLLERYNASGPDALGDGHRHNGPKPRLLTPEVLEVVRLRLAEPPPDGGRSRPSRWYSLVGCAAVPGWSQAALRRAVVGSSSRPAMVSSVM